MHITDTMKLDLMRGFNCLLPLEDFDRFFCSLLDSCRASAYINRNQYISEGTPRDISKKQFDERITLGSGIYGRRVIQQLHDRLDYALMLSLSGSYQEIQDVIDDISVALGCKKI